jgi:hypothetical protein
MQAVPAALLGDHPLLASVPAMARFTKRKRYHAPIANLLRQAPELVEMARSIQNCAEALEILLELPEGGDPFAVLTDFNPCRRRACPMQGLDAFFDSHPTHRAIFATFTVRNVPLGDLGQAIKDLHAAWRLLVKWRQFPTEFWFRRTEITIGQPTHTDDLPRAPKPRSVDVSNFAPSLTEVSGGPLRAGEAHLASSQALNGVWCHPHIHTLLLVPASYFSHGYITQGEWQKQWMMAGRLDYAPVVDIRRARAKFTTGEAFYDAKAAGIEAMKYAVKATDMLKMAADLPEFIHQTRGHQLVGMSGALRQFVPEHDPTAAEMADDRQAGLPRLHPGVSCLAQWDRDLSEYVLTPR